MHCGQQDINRRRTPSEARRKPAQVETPRLKRFLRCVTQDSTRGAHNAVRLAVVHLSWPWLGLRRSGESQQIYRAVFVATVDNLVEQVGSLVVKREVANLVD